VQNFSYYVYFFCPHVWSDYVPIIRRNNCTYATLGTCYSAWMTVCYAGWNENILRNKRTKKYGAPIWLYLQDLQVSQVLFGMMLVITG